MFDALSVFLLQFMIQFMVLGSIVSDTKVGEPKKTEYISQVKLDLDIKWSLFRLALAENDICGYAHHNSHQCYNEPGDP